MKLSFLILGYKHKNHLRICLKHISNLDLEIEYEVIFVDNASGDGSAEMVAELYPNVRIIENETNIGHPAGNNVGLRQAKGEYIAMINPDIILQSKQDIIDILDYMDREDRVALLGPKLHNPNGSIQNSCYRPYGRLTPLYRRSFFKKLPWAKRDIDRHLMTDFNHNSTIEVDWILGACMFIRNTALSEIGIMNEDFFLYLGDYEWCDRARLHNWKVIYYHDTDGIIHYHKRESDSGLPSAMQLLSPVTRIHIKDWNTYKKIARAHE